VAVDGIKWLVAGVGVDLREAVDWWGNPGSACLVGGDLLLESIIGVAVLVVSVIICSVGVVAVLVAAVVVAAVVVVAVVGMVVVVIDTIGSQPICHHPDGVIYVIELRLIIEDRIVTGRCWGECGEVRTPICCRVGRDLVAIVVVGRCVAVACRMAVGGVNSRMTRLGSSVLFG